MWNQFGEIGVGQGSNPYPCVCAKAHGHLSIQGQGLQVRCRLGKNWVEQDALIPLCTSNAMVQKPVAFVNKMAILRPLWRVLSRCHVCDTLTQRR